LDDIRNPKDPQYEKYGAKGDEIWVKTPNEAIKILSTGLVKSISLDHDLQLPDPENGYKVAKWIEEAAYFGKISKLTWKIHTDNPTGKANMLLALKNADRYWDRLG